jgi:hypothetical protein
MPTHVGVTIFSAQAGRAFRKLIPMNRKTDFEAVVLPRLVYRFAKGPIDWSAPPQLEPVAWDSDAL